MIEELYKKHRPTKLSDVVGQPDAVRMLKDMGRRGAVPHCLMLSGPSGVGKTTIARILREKLECSDADFAELNTADFRGIDMVREIRQRVGLAPLGGKSRVWLVDEAHKLTVDAQHAFLKLLEDTPKHVWFFLATTEPQKLLLTIRTRATEMKLRALKSPELKALVLDVAGREGMELSDEVSDKIADVADGSARKALVLLNQIVGVEGEEDRLATVAAGDATAAAVEIARALIRPGVRWPEVAKLLKSVDEEPEAVRRMVLGYFCQVLLGGGKMADRAFKIIDVMSRNFFDSGKAGLAAACYEIVTEE